MFCHCRAAIATLLTILSANACSNAPVMVNAPRSFTLAEANGKPIPVERGSLPTPVHVGCKVLLYAGSLDLDQQNLSFQMVLANKDSCTGQLLSQEIERGAFQQVGSELTFRPQGDGRTTFTGTMQTGERLQVRYYEDQLVFVAK